MLERIDAALCRSIDAFVELYRGMAVDASELATVAQRLSAAGGKRIRAQLFYWGWRAAGRQDCEAVIELAVAFEVLHLFALTHDDVMDRSPLRRGVRSAHSQFADVHHDQRWRGNSDHFGTSAAILCGDALMMWADSLVDSSSLLNDRLSVFRRGYNSMKLELVGGQYLDIVGEYAGDLGAVGDVLTIARLKSGNYSIAAPLHLAGIAAGADKRTLTMFKDIGIPLGEAFQLQDDLMGTFGTAESVGKPVGDDIRHGKRTSLIAVALSVSDAHQAETLAGLLAKVDLSDDEVQDATRLIAHSGAPAIIEAMIEQRLRSALHKLANSGMDIHVREVLAELLLSPWRQGRCNDILPSINHFKKLAEISRDATAVR